MTKLQAVVRRAVGPAALTFLFGCGLDPCQSAPHEPAPQPTGDLVKNNSTTVGCSCTVFFEDGSSAPLPNVASDGDVPVAKGPPFKVCLPPELNMQLDAGANSLDAGDWSAKVDNYCTQTVGTAVRDLIAYLSRINCDNVKPHNNITKVVCAHAAIGAIPADDAGADSVPISSATSPDLGCAKDCAEIDCNPTNCNPKDVAPEDHCHFGDVSDCSTHLDQCRCTVFTSSLPRFSACGFTENSPRFCHLPPGGVDPPANKDGLLSAILSAPNTVAFDHAASNAQLTVKFDDGFGFSHEQTRTIGLSGGATLYGFCQKGIACDLILDLTMYAEDTQFHFSDVVCGVAPPCFHDVNVSATRMVATAGTRDIRVHFDANGIGRIPLGVLQIRAEAVIGGVPDKPTQRWVTEIANDQPIDMLADFSAKTFSVSGVPFSAANTKGILNLSGRITNQPPTANAGGDHTVECSSPVGGVVTLDGSQSSDPDNNIFAVQWWKGGAIFDPQGSASVASTAVATVVAPFSPPRLITPYSLSVSDWNLATRIDESRVTVQDTTAPTVRLALSPSCLWAPDHKMVLFRFGSGVQASANDACDPSPVVTVDAVRSSQPFTGGGSGNASPDYRFGKHAFCLRAEREGMSALPRAYTVSVRATDASGNSASADAVVRVGHDQASLSCPKVDPSLVVADDDPRCRE